MKSLLLIFAALSISSFAQGENVSVEKCEKKVARYYAYNGSRSDYPKEIRQGYYLHAGESLLNLRKQEIASFEEDKIIYQGNGSFHSGYFIEAIVVNPKTCKVEEVFELYGE